MLLRFYLLFCFLIATTAIPSAVVVSKGKQQKFFPKELKKKGVYLGMSLEKFEKKITLDQLTKRPSEFNIHFTETIIDSQIISYTYLFTKSNTSKLYSIEIAYNEMDGVRQRAITLLGQPQDNGEWRISQEQIKEDFTMGVWSFGQKIVYGATVAGSEWENGFQSR